MHSRSSVASKPNGRSTLLANSVRRWLLSAGCALAATVATDVALAAQTELPSATVGELQAAMDKGTLTSEKLIQMSLARIKAYDDAGPKLNADRKSVV